jgi:hypothetical protein
MSTSDNLSESEDYSSTSSDFCSLVTIGLFILCGWESQLEEIATGVATSRYRFAIDAASEFWGLTLN